MNHWSASRMHPPPTIPCAPYGTWEIVMQYQRPFVLVFLPFASGYFLSYVYRTINAVICTELSTGMQLRASHMGLLAALYFLSFAAMQLPVGLALDRYGPRRVQGTLLLVAAIGAVIFSNAHSLAELSIGRALIGAGVAAGLIAGLKSIVLWFPKERLPLLNGCFIMLGTLGAVTATVPAEQLVGAIGWRAMFFVLALATAGCAVIILVLSPEPVRAAARPQLNLGTLKTIYASQRFWALAPLSTMCISTAWALQGLWANPWLTDVEHLGRAAIVRHLFVMAAALCVGALLFGLVAQRLRRYGIPTQFVLAAVGVLFIAVELALIMRLRVSSYLIWAIIGSVGAATVLSFTILTDYFPTEITGQATAALNILHIGGAFVLQYAIGLGIDIWGSVAGHYPPVAYAVTLAVIVSLQMIALAWFASSEMPRWQPARVSVKKTF
jgi:MFS family permease